MSYSSATSSASAFRLLPIALSLTLAGACCLMQTGCESLGAADSAPASGAAIDALQPVPPAPQLAGSLSLAPAPSSMPEGISYSGGDGTTFETAVIVQGATSARAATRAEYAWLRNRFPGFKRRDLNLLRHKGRYYDAIVFDTANGQSRTVYFDTSAMMEKR